MSQPRVSSTTQTLLRAARADGPSAAIRAKMWSGVSGAVTAAAAGTAPAGTAAGATPTHALALSGGTSAAKALAMGTLLGGALTVGLATVLLSIGPTPGAFRVAERANQEKSARTPTAVLAAAPQPGLAPRPARSAFAAQPEDPVPSLADPPVTGSVIPQTAPAAPVLGTRSSVKAPAAPNAARSIRPAAVEPDDMLSREVALVTEAREALLRGDPRAALRGVRAARGLPSPRLQPEELSVESQALRALGREDDARDTDSTLRRQFPESGLAR